MLGSANQILRPLAILPADFGWCTVYREYRSIHTHGRSIDTCTRSHLFVCFPYILGPGMWLGVGVTPSLRVGLSGISHRQKWVREAGMWFHIGLPYPQRRRRVQ